MPPTRKFLRTYALVWVLLLAGFAVTGIVGWNLFRRARELDENRFNRQVRQTTEIIRDRVERYELALVSLADFAALRPNFTPAEWGFRVRLLLPEKNYPGLLELGVAEWDAQASAPPTETLWPAEDEDGDREESPLRLRHVWVSPPSAFDGMNPRFLNDPAIAQTARAAIQANAPRYCYRRELATELAGKPARGFTVFAPFFHPGGEPAPTNLLARAETSSARPQPAPVTGVVFGSIEPNLLFASLFGTAPREVGFDLFSSEPPSAKTWLNVSASAPPSLSPGFNPYLQTRTTLRFHGQEWVLLLYTTALFERESSRYQPWTTVASGAALTVLTAALLFTQMRGRLRQEEIAAELRAACEDLQAAQNERERIGRDLHDGAIQSLYGLQLALGQLERQQPRDPAAAQVRLRECRTALDALIAELRTFIVQHVPGDESPDRVANASAALQQLVHRFQSATRVPIELVLKDSPPTPVTLAQQVHLRQIAQEAISNSLRHSRARHIKVELYRRNHHLHLRIADDGAGFEMSKSHRGQGLANMQARAAQLGGSLNVTSQPGHGTQVALDLPVAGESIPPHGQDL